MVSCALLLAEIVFPDLHSPCTLHIVQLWSGLPLCCVLAVPCRLIFRTSSCTLPFIPPRTALLVLVDCCDIHCSLIPKLWSEPAQLHSAAFCSIALCRCVGPCGLICWTCGLLCTAPCAAILVVLDWCVIHAGASCSHHVGFSPCSGSADPTLLHPGLAD